MTYMQDKTQPQSYPLRMPAELRDKIEESAIKNKRSLNAEILDRLDNSFKNMVDLSQPVTLIQTLRDDKEFSVHSPYRRHDNYITESISPQKIEPKGIEPLNPIHQQLAELTKEVRELKEKIDKH